MKAQSAQDEENVFRATGNKTTEERIISAVTSGQNTDEFKSPEFTIDTANALKKWFRSMHEPLIPTKLYNTFIDAGADVSQLTNAVSTLPPENYKCFRTLCEYLLTIAYVM